jgi:hypothetical protein
MEAQGALTGERGGGNFELRVDRPYTPEEERAVAEMLGVERQQRQKPSLYQGNFGDEGPYFADPYEPKFYSQKGKHGEPRELTEAEIKAEYGAPAVGILAIGDDEADPGSALTAGGVLDTAGRIGDGFREFGEAIIGEVTGSALGYGSMLADNLRGNPADYEKAKKMYNKLAHGTELLADDPSLENFRAADILNDFATQHPYVGGTLQGLMDTGGDILDAFDVNKAPEWAHPFIYATGVGF